MGLGTIEVWQNTGNPVGFPFSRVTVIPRGLAGPSAVAGFEASDRRLGGAGPRGQFGLRQARAQPGFPHEGVSTHVTRIAQTL